MGLNDTPSGNRIHIGFFGRRNAGKSSLVNAVTGQDLAIVSEQKGTTTDPVYKAMELLPLGPVVIIDTPGIDDEGDLGTLRVQRARRVLNKTDIAILVLDAEVAANNKLCPEEEELVTIFKEKNIPFIIALNKSDLVKEFHHEPHEHHEHIPVSAITGFNINELKEKIAALADTGKSEKHLVADLIQPADFVVLVIPIDKSAPKGRLILPQQQVIRDILEANAVAVTVRENGLRDTLTYFASKGEVRKQPALVITDSQVFAGCR